MNQQRVNNSAYSTGLAALCSFCAAAIHFAVAPEHFEEC
jgi:hypothetical protein